MRPVSDVDGVPEILRQIQSITFVWLPVDLLENQFIRDPLALFLDPVIQVVSAVKVRINGFLKTVQIRDSVRS